MPRHLSLRTSQLTGRRRAGYLLLPLVLAGSALAAVAALPRLGLNAYQASLGYMLSSSLELSAGWQGWNYGRASGVFFNAAPRLKLDAEFVHMSFHTSP